MNDALVTCFADADEFQRGVPLDFLQAMAEAEAEGQSIKLSAFMPDGSSVSHELNSKAKSKDSKKSSHKEPTTSTASQSAKSSATNLNKALKAL